MFDNAKNLEELKKAYKKAALKAHPDMGGSNEAMKEVNVEYSRVFEVLKINQNAAAEKGQGRATTETPEEFKQIVEILLKLEGLEVELCGSWLWIAGDTYSHKAELKAAGCRWSRNKQKWYWRHAEKGCYWSRGKKSMEDIRETYGSEWLRGSNRQNLKGA